jgi:hypothetical protein
MNLNISISYSNDLEYQTILLCIFSNTDLGSSTDEEFEKGLDNIDFDKGLEFILEKTNDNPIFKELYVLASSKMFSENPDIGLVILLSYDFLKLFYPILVEYIHYGTINTNNLNFLKTQLTLSS